MSDKGGLMNIKFLEKDGDFFVIADGDEIPLPRDFLSSITGITSREHAEAKAAGKLLAEKDGRISYLQSELERYRHLFKIIEAIVDEPY